MDNQPDQTINQPSVNENDAPQRDKRAKFNKFALLAILLAAGAWVVLSFDGKMALVVGALAFISSCFGLKASTRTWRNTATTAMVASSVLIIVLAAFMIVINVGLNAI